jgi:hypothetical protein
MAVQYAFGKIITQGLDLNVDAADPTSYPGTGTSWTSVVNRSITGSLVSCSFSSDFKGGIVFNNPSASVQFPGTVANYGTGSFTIEMAFRPSHIEGIHYLVSKNSGSFPNWGVYLSGSGGSGKLFAEYRINASVSCSVSSSTTFVTGSNYFVDTVFSPGGRRIYIVNEGNTYNLSPISNGSGLLNTTGSLFLGNFTSSSSQAYSGSIFNTKIYSSFTSGYNNYKSIAQRLEKPVPARPANALALIVGGGGAGGQDQGGGGGAGGLILTEFLLTSSAYVVTVGGGGARVTSGPGNNGSNSSLGGLLTIGGGRGGNYNSNGDNGGSGGGTGRNFGTPTGGLGTIGQGNNGVTGPSSLASGAGGGGISTSGSLASGGNGLIIGLLGYDIEYSKGGNGLPSNTIGNSGQPNTGGGGDGGGSAAGGSGIVIIRYPGPPIATGGTITSVDGDTVHAFTATGSSTFTVF